MAAATASFDGALSQLQAVRQPSLDLNANPEVQLWVWSTAMTHWALRSHRYLYCDCISICTGMPSPSVPLAVL